MRSLAMAFLVVIALSVEIDIEEYASRLHAEAEARIEKLGHAMDEQELHQYMTFRRRGIEAAFSAGASVAGFKESSYWFDKALDMHAKALRKPYKHLLNYEAYVSHLQGKDKSYKPKPMNKDHEAHAQVESEKQSSELVHTAFLSFLEEESNAVKSHTYYRYDRSKPHF